MHGEARVTCRPLVFSGEGDLEGESEIEVSGEAQALEECRDQLAWRR